MAQIFNVIDVYTVFYPVVMSIVWMFGAVMANRQEQIRHKGASVSIVMSVFNESDTIMATLNSLKNINYENLTLVIVDDKSSDDTVALVERFKEQNPETSLTLLPLPENGGKASAINTAIRTVVKSEFVLVTDADALMQRDAVQHLLNGFNTPTVGAVTGKPVVRNRSTMLGTMQAIEYLGVVDNIKRAENFLFRRIMTVSGVLVMYRASALIDIHGFNPTVMTEDIDATWRLYKGGWQVRYAPAALTYILVPERIRGFIKQRKRWSIGGLEVLLTNFKWAMKRGDFGTRFLQIEMVLSHLWSWSFLLSTVNYFTIFYLTLNLKIVMVVLGLYALMGALLVIISLLNDRAKSLISGRDMLVWPLYFVFYWLGNFTSALLAEWTLVFGQTEQGAWDSPDRGI